MKNTIGSVFTATDLVKSYPDFQLGPISLQLTPGTVYGLVGPNGSGKTTLLNCLAGQSRSDGGRIAVGGKLIRWNSLDWRKRVGLIHERPAAYDQLSVNSNLELAADLSPAWDPAFARELIERLKLERRRRVSELSRGNLVKLLLVCAIASRPDFLFLDEPSAGLDPTSRMELQEVVRTLAREHRISVMISSHIFEDIETAADEVFFLKAGRLALHSIGTERDSLRDTYIGLYGGVR